MAKHTIYKFPKSRIATIDICEIGKRKHHVTGLIEVDVTKSREAIREYNRKNKNKISFNAWMIYVICNTIKSHKTAAAYLKGKNRLMIFDDINVSMIVEKELNGQKVPIPLLIERSDKKSIEEIQKKITDAKNKAFTGKDIVLQKKADRLERIYYLLPGFLRRSVWRYMLRHPKLAHRKMGNVAITSLGMMGQVKGWFIPISVHPICFGLSSVVKKPVAIDNKVEIREMLQMSVLVDHDVIDGAPMARFISELSANIEKQNDFGA